MRASHILLKDDPLRTGTMTDLGFDSLLYRVSNIEGFFTFAQQNPATQTPASAKEATAAPPTANKATKLALKPTQSAAFLPSKPAVPSPSTAGSEPKPKAPVEVASPSRVIACPEQGRKEAVSSEGTTKRLLPTLNSPAPSELTVTRDAKVMEARPRIVKRKAGHPEAAKEQTAQPGLISPQFNQAIQAALKNHPDPNAFAVEYFDNLIAPFEEGEATLTRA
jgi:hypothetical protein